jgi:hypothetical protein
MKDRYNHPIFEFRGEVLEILDTKKGRFIFTFKAEGYTRVLNFMLTAAVDHYRGMIEPGARLKVKAQTKNGVLTSMIYPGYVEILERG